ncbi:MAG: hypothetical protein ACFBSE_08320 [Prochloraceae cyanobacterium]
MSLKKEDSWQDIPEAIYPQWAEIFYQSQEGLNLSASCPVCKQKTLHCYYLPSSEQKKITIEGKKYYAGRSDVWQWCSSCRSYLHASAAVPECWSCNLSIDRSKLTNNPQALEESI